MPRKKVTRQLRITVLAQQGLEDWEIAERLGCSERDVRLGRQRASVAAAKRKPVTRHFRIVELARAGVGDAEIAEAVGCRLEYVRVVRQRAGLCQRRARTGAAAAAARHLQPQQRKAA